jgi:putative membrane protein
MVYAAPMIISWLSFTCFTVAAILHFGFFVFESILLPKPHWYKKMGYTDESFKPVKAWAINQGIYNLCLSLGTLTGLYFIFKKQIMLAGVLTSFCGLTMIATGICLWLTQKKLRKAALLQILPPTIGFLFLTAHIIERIS